MIFKNDDELPPDPQFGDEDKEMREPEIQEEEDLEERPDMPGYKLDAERGYVSDGPTYNGTDDSVLPERLRRSYHYSRSRRRRGYVIGCVTIRSHGSMLPSTTFSVASTSQAAT